jgi:hypothetical protein
MPEKDEIIPTGVFMRTPETMFTLGFMRLLTRRGAAGAHERGNDNQTTPVPLHTNRRVSVSFPTFGALLPMNVRKNSRHHYPGRFSLLQGETVSAAADLRRQGGRYPG